MKKIFMTLAAVAAMAIVFPQAAEARTCPACSGKGGREVRIVIPNYSGSTDAKTDHYHWEECWRCRGTGQIDDNYGY